MSCDKMRKMLKRDPNEKNIMCKKNFLIKLF